MRIWETARTANEIAMHYDQVLSGDEPGLVALYTFAGESGDALVRDFAGENHGYFVNMDPSVDRVVEPVSSGACYYEYYPRWRSHSEIISDMSS